MSVRRGYKAVSCGQIHYRYAGAAGAPVLVLLHQTPSSSEMFEPLMLELVREFRMIAPDLPGMGMSDPLPGDVSIAGYAKHVAECLDELNVDEAFVFGHHTGASVAVQLAIDHPEVVAALALSGPPVLDDALRKALPEMAKPIAPRADGGHLGDMWQRISGKDDSAPIEIVQRETISGLRLGEHYPDPYAAVIEHDIDRQLQMLRIPTVVFAGTGDPLFSQLQNAADLLKNGSLARIEGARSFVCETHLDDVAELLRGFYRREAA